MDTNVLKAVSHWLILVTFFGVCKARELTVVDLQHPHWKPWKEQTFLEGAIESSAPKSVYSFAQIFALILALTREPRLTAMLEKGWLGRG